MRLAIGLLLFSQAVGGQIHQFPYLENFDIVTPPALPAGWSTSYVRHPSGDFSTMSSSPRSTPNAVASVNATVEQSLESPVFDFSDLRVDSLIFHERRSSTHDSGLLLEVSTDGGESYSSTIGDTFRIAAAGTYVVRRLPLPEELDNEPTVRFRWRVVGDGSGTSGTLRFDDIVVTARSLREISIVEYPYSESFNDIVIPSLPPGWSTSTSRMATGDFSTTSSTPRSPPAAVISTNSTIAQELRTPLLDFSGLHADSVSFYERRSSTHTSGLMLEASHDGGSTFDIIVSDTIKNAGVTSYVYRSFAMPPLLTGLSRVKLRWRVVGDGGGTSATLRVDDIVVYASTITGTVVELLPGIAPHRFILEPNYPNPFNSSTTIRFGVPTRSNISVTIYDLSGRKVATLVSGSIPSGMHQCRWDASSVASGVYLLQFRANEHSSSMKLVFIR